MNGILLVFVDGLGIGCDDPEVNPVHAGRSPVLAKLIGKDSVPVDVGMGVDGLPQSATGQTALLTGVNAARAVGRHIEGFPGEPLCRIIRDENIFAKCGKLGLRSTFANAYYVSDMEAVKAHRWKSVTTVAALSAFGQVRDTEAMLAGNAVYQDITREMLRKRGYDGPLVEPKEAASQLASIAMEHHLTLFEYFQTDRAGHAADMESAVKVLALLDEFLGALLDDLKEKDILFLLTSDHGNIEDVRTNRHTLNPVPLVAVGPGSSLMRERVDAVTDITPAILDLLTGGK
jgi:hypothetical protein